MAGARDYNPPPPFFSSTRPFKHQIKESAAAKAYEAEWKWMNSSESKQRSDAAKAQALSDFKKRFPSSKTKSTGHQHSGLLWGRNKMVAFLISCHYYSKTNHHPSQSQQSRSQTTQGKALRIFLTSR